MCCRHMVLHQMGDELDGPSPIYACDDEAATGDSFGGLEGDELTIAHPRDIGGVAATIPTRSLKLLEERGLTERGPHPDGLIKAMKLTLKGRKTLAVAPPFWAHAQDTVLREWGAKAEAGERRD